MSGRSTARTSTRSQRIDALAAGADLADPGGARLARGDASDSISAPLVRAAHTTIRPMPMLKVRNMSSSGTRPSAAATRRAAAPPTTGSIDGACSAVRQHARQVVGDPAAGDVRHALRSARRRAAAGSAAGTSDAARAARRRSIVPSSGTSESTPQPGDLERDPPRERVAVGVQAGRGQADQDVAGARCAVPSISRRACDAPTMKPATSYSPSA